MDILRDLGLSPDQVRQMRLINQDVRTKRQAARVRMNEAGRNLDQAIYADTVDDALFTQRLKEFQNAQGEMSKVNFDNELAIRKVLTSEQLVRFREIRQSFQRRRQNRIEKRDMQRPGVEPQRVQPGEKPPVKNIRSGERKRPV
jgi:Spy/CpxP family protein refolding chaperone